MEILKNTRTISLTWEDIRKLIKMNDEEVFVLQRDFVLPTVDETKQAIKFDITTKEVKTYFLNVRDE